ncbi:hypothetical protein QTL97_09695 [Sporosarcina thermotolerans]|uniref:Bacteriocin immunity protein n=2 Tax=Sporosarcina thermotolerans TaxID=633404 RepID=A0AAW9A9Z4_9BACL|nr:hypothetical protein [Sporosarcina thermotolerans]MDW0117210.1 hypothetical protein [Sporosarcina thermotolerans]
MEMRRKKPNNRVREFYDEIDKILENIQSNDGFNKMDKLVLKKILNDSKLAFQFGHIAERESNKNRYREYLMSNGTSGNRFVNLLLDYPKLGKYFGG